MTAAEVKKPSPRFYVPHGYTVYIGSYPQYPQVKMYVCQPKKCVYINQSADEYANIVQLVSI